MYISRFLAYPQGVQPSPQLILGIFVPSKKILYTFAVTRCFHTHTLPSPWQLLSVSVDFPVLDISYKWNQITCDFLWLTSSTWLDVLKFICCSVYQYFIPFRGWIIFHCMDRPHLGGFHILSIMYILLLWAFMYKSAHPFLHLQYSIAFLTWLFWLFWLM